MPRQNKDECARQDNEILVTMLQARKDKLEPGHKQRHTYQKAINSIRACPLVIQNELMAQSLDGIGKHIGKLIKKTLQDADRYSVENSAQVRHHRVQRLEERIDANNARKKKQNKQKKQKKQKKQNQSMTPRSKINSHSQKYIQQGQQALKNKLVTACLSYLDDCSLLQLINP